MSLRFDNMDDQGAAVIKMPQLVGTDAMEGGEGGASQQKINRSGRHAVASIRFRQTVL